MAHDDRSRDFCGSGDHWRELRRRAREARKERVLHTRVSDRLADDIRGIAEDLRVPVSNLVRNVLEEVFDAVESVSDDLGGVLEEVMDEAEGASRRVLRARERVRQRRERRRRHRHRHGNGHGGHGHGLHEDELREAAEDVETGPPETPPPPIEWHFVEEGRRRGPVRHDELARLVRHGRVGSDALVWCAGMTDWQRAGDVAGLARLFEPPPPPEVPGASDAPGPPPPPEG